MVKWNAISCVWGFFFGGVDAVVGFRCSSCPSTPTARVRCRPTNSAALWRPQVRVHVVKLGSPRHLCFRQADVCNADVYGGVWQFFCSPRWRNEPEQPAPAAHLPEVRRRQLRHRLWRLPHLHCPSGEHVPYVTVALHMTICQSKSCWVKLCVSARSLPGSGWIQEGTCQNQLGTGRLGWIPSSVLGSITMLSLSLQCGWSLCILPTYSSSWWQWTSEEELDPQLEPPEE